MSFTIEVRQNIEGELDNSLFYPVLGFIEAMDKFADFTHKFSGLPNIKVSLVNDQSLFIHAIFRT